MLFALERQCLSSLFLCSIVGEPVDNHFRSMSLEYDGGGLATYDEDDLLSAGPLPVVEGHPIEAVHQEVVGDALAVISRKRFDELDAMDDDAMVKRNSFRNLHRPDMTYLGWVQESVVGKEEVIRSDDAFASSA